MNENEIMNEELDTNEDYLATIKELKANSVDRKAYDKLREENRNLLKSLIEGQNLEQPAEPEQKYDAGELKTLLASGDLNNVQFIDTALKLRKTIMDDGGADPFIPSSHNYSPTRDDVETAERVAEVFQHCVDYSEGNSEVFTNELARLTRDNFNPRLRK